jgi:hypothetical protein
MQAAPGNELEETIHALIQAPRTREVITTWVQKGTAPEFSQGRTDVGYFARFNSFGNRVVTGTRIKDDRRNRH